MIQFLATNQGSDLHYRNKYSIWFLREIYLQRMIQEPSGFWSSFGLQTPKADLSLVLVHEEASVV